MFRLYDKKAYELLKKCSNKRDMSEWNEYREKTGNQTINLRFANLEKFYLQGANLKNVDFRFTSIRQTEMSNADVQNVKLAVYRHYFALVFLLATIIFSIIPNIHISIDSTVNLVFTANISAVFILGSLLLSYTAATLLFIDISVIAFVFAFIINTIGGIHIGTPNIAGTIAMLGVAIVIGAFIVVSIFVINTDIDMNQTAIGNAKNPEMAIGFNPKYKETDISAEIKELEQKLEEITDEEEINETLQKIESKKQQKTIKNAIEILKEPYRYLEDEIKKFSFHNYFFYGTSAICIIIAGIYALFEYQNREGYMGVLFGDVKSVDFGSILGLSLFYGTPIIFLTFVIIYAVSQINKNIDKAHELSTQKHYIEILASTFNSKTEAGATDEEIQKDLKMAADTIRDATIAKMLGKEKKEEDKESTKKDRYREIVDAKAAFALFSTMLKNSK